MKDKELVDVIVDKLKNIKEPPYKDGAWEKFKSQKLPVARYQHTKIWYAAASLLLFLGIGAAVLWVQDNDYNAATDHAVSNSTMTEGVESEQPTGIDQHAITPPSAPDIAMSDARAESIDLYTTGEKRENKLNDLGMLVAGTAIELVETVSIPQLTAIPLANFASLQDVQVPAINTGSRPQDLYLAQSSLHKGDMLDIKSTENQTPRTNIRLSDRFELGLFVSPYATSNQMNVGAGLALSYKLNKNLSLRTGASYNNYEIQTLKNPINVASTEFVPAEGDHAVLANAGAKNASYQTQMIIPNVNAVTGFVKSIDIPLEVKVNDNTDAYYATAGMSYSAIFNQERRAHYVENLNRETFENGYPESKQEAEAAVKPITKTVVSAEDNVNTNGFSGFVNFSVGRNVRVNNKIKVSVEPYLKIPVGQYRRADMDYTNGGIRVMTNF